MDIGTLKEEGLVESFIEEIDKDPELRQVLDNMTPEAVYRCDWSCCFNYKAR
jgi:hypothetical protein